MSGPPSHSPARFVPTYALGFAAGGEAIETVSAEQPLPVVMAQPASSAGPLQGSASAPGSAGPLVPTPGSPVTLVLGGSWQGTVRVERSTDGGATRHPLTVGGMRWGVFTANACEQVWEEVDPAAELYLDLAITGGTIEYRMGH